VRRRFDDSDQVAAVRADIRRRKALDWLVERVEVVDEDGAPIDRADLLPSDPADDGEPGEAEVAGEDAAPGPDAASVESPPPADADHEEDTE